MKKLLTKLFNGVCDVAVVVGSAVGVGLISGKETQVFIGVLPNMVIFAVVFCVILSVFREFCRKNGAANTSKLACACFGRFSVAFRFVLTLCSFVCVVTCLAGVEQCLSDILYLSPLPLYAVCVASIAAFVMINGMPALKICNVISLVMAAGLFVALACSKADYAALAVAPKPYMPVVYALFTFTMSMCVTCKLGAKSSRIGNVVSSVVSAVTIALLLAVVTFLADFTQPLPTLSAITNPYLKAYAVVTVALNTMCGIVGCALPVVEQADSVIGDKTTSSLSVFLISCAFSMFGFDFLVKFGYVFVALIGAITLIAIAVSQRRLRRKAATFNA